MFLWVTVGHIYRYYEWQIYETIIYFYERLKGNQKLESKIKRIIIIHWVKTRQKDL